MPARMLLIVLSVVAFAFMGAGSASAQPEPMLPTVVSSQWFPDGIADLTIEASAEEVSATAGCGWRWAYGTVRFHNHFHVTLWTYRQAILWSWCNYKVTGVQAFYDEPVDTCCGWGWHGNVAKWRSVAGGPVVTTYTKGLFSACIPYLCNDKYPWVQLRVNGNGLLTGFAWGIDS